MAVLIEAELPQRWQDLEAGVARILADCGYDVEVGKNVKLARGDADIDVWADDHSQPPNVLAVECKLWADPVTKEVVHGFRTRVGESGANLGLLVSAAGFQAGAVEAAAYSNVQLLTWIDFQKMFTERWFRRYLIPRLSEEMHALHEYTEPINSRIFRKAGRLTDDRKERFKALRQVHVTLGSLYLAFRGGLVDGLLVDGEARDVPRGLPKGLPLRADGADIFGLGGAVPDDVLDATALRPLLDALVEHSRRATAEFDAVFGERA